MKLLAVALEADVDWLPLFCFAFRPLRVSNFGLPGDSSMKSHEFLPCSDQNSIFEMVVRLRATAVSRKPVHFQVLVPARNAPLLRLVADSRLFEKILVSLKFVGNFIKSEDSETIWVVKRVNETLL